MHTVVDYAAGVEEARAWLIEHKAEAQLSWPQIAKFTDAGPSTLSLFASDSYAGDNTKVATKVLAYRDRLHMQTEIIGDSPMVPEWYDTATSRRITELLRWAQSGEFVLIVTDPGIGKTITAERFASADPNVWLATMSPATAGVGTMSAEVAEAIGLGQLVGSPQQLSRKVRDFVRGKSGLIIVDEAQELTDKAINEIRGWYDRTKVGVALLGNSGVLGRSKSRTSALAQVVSRFSMRHSQASATPEDIAACLDAWGIADEQQRDFLHRIGRMPGALREVTHTLKIALMASFSAGTPLTLNHLEQAARERSPQFGAL
ncbi:AAA family ATPase [Novosphingobium sp. LASN5T]|uniref:AAA family ATPase n=1 Tax=Novosphingobium sp. LASN5T TaxID=2491021 RepID=UPI001680A557|nr:AAA family ATPase [Novosphingobium sp. LASN5T]